MTDLLRTYIFVLKPNLKKDPRNRGFKLVSIKGINLGFHHFYFGIHKGITFSFPKLVS